MVETEDKSPCDGCNRVFPARLLDAVLLDEEGNEASDKAYCKSCWPRYKRVPSDRWREG